MARLSYPKVAPEGYAALSAFGHYVNTATALEPVLLGLVYLRASVLNGCTFCTELHKSELRHHNEPETRIGAVVNGPTEDAFTPRELAALRWTDTLTNLQGRHASEEDYQAVERFFHDKDLVDLSFAIANINAWNRMGVAFQPAWRPRPDPVKGHFAEPAGAVAAAPQRSAAQASQASQPVGDGAGVATLPREAAPHPEIEDDGGKVSFG